MTQRAVDYDWKPINITARRPCSIFPFVVVEEQFQLLHVATLEDDNVRLDELKDDIINILKKNTERKRQVYDRTTVLVDGPTVHVVRKNFCDLDVLRRPLL
ncbi:MAG: hypothetical protein ACLRSW_15780 [Christensenellaceae bacterium]